MMQEKSKLRKILLEKRLSLPGRQVQDYSQGIIKKLITYVNWGEIKHINTYQTLKSKNEVDIALLLNFLNAEYPSIKIEFAENKMSQAQDVPSGESYDLVIVPLLGFDRSDHRLGYGGGYYDKFLAKNNYKLTVGLAYSFQEVKKLPVEDHDQKLDLIITEREVIKP